MSYKGVQLAHIVAKDLDGCIGKDNALPWHIPADLRRFQSLTSGGVVVMGRKTFESMGKTLPDRINIVLTSNENYDDGSDLMESGAMIVHCIEDALDLAAKMVKGTRGKNKNIWIVGGEQVYRATLPYVDYVEATIVQTRVKGDTHYPVNAKDVIITEFSDIKTDEQSGLNYIHSIYFIDDNKEAIYGVM